MTDGSLTVATTSNHELRLDPPSRSTGRLAASVRTAPGWPSGKKIVFACAEPSRTEVVPDSLSKGATWCCWVGQACFDVLEVDARRIQNWLDGLRDPPAEPAPSSDPMPTDGLGYGAGNPVPVPMAPVGEL